MEREFLAGLGWDLGVFLPFSVGGPRPVSPTRADDTPMLRALTAGISERIVAWTVRRGSLTPASSPVPSASAPITTPPASPPSPSLPPSSPKFAPRASSLSPVATHPKPREPVPVAHAATGWRVGVGVSGREVGLEMTEVVKCLAIVEGAVEGCW
ncbi:hypothetical protein HDU96_005382 [Phlyctochytrium bullatum]|nr:hypothetical protein HDU96_005382 [Phlyctochytrium bullatum]